MKTIAASFLIKLDKPVRTGLSEYSSRDGVVVPCIIPEPGSEKLPPRIF
jgi:hypothetical protein